MEPKGSLLCTQKRGKALIAEPDESSLHYTSYTNSLKYLLILLYPHHRKGLLNP